MNERLVPPVQPIIDWWIATFGDWYWYTLYPFVDLFTRIIPILPP